ncbi:MAG: hypothetical protein ACI4AM_03620 [Muribaculaceae bacterium]
MKAKAIQVVPVIAAIIATTVVTPVAKALVKVLAQLFAMALVTEHAKAVVPVVALSLLTKRGASSMLASDSQYYGYQMLI